MLGAINNEVFLKTVNVPVVWGITRKANNDKYPSSLFPSETAVSNLQVQSSYSPSQIQLLSWETRSIKLIYLLELIDFRPQQFAALGQSLWSPTF